MILPDTLGGGQAQEAQAPAMNIHGWQAVPDSVKTTFLA
jgi:hypothetical protein